MVFAQAPHKVMLDDELHFTGSDSQSADPAELEDIVIGLVAPGHGHPVGRAMIDGATLACEQANAQGGYASLPFRIVRRWADNPWGAGSTEVIRLTYEDHAWALVGGPDGQTTHVAQQIATKAHLVLISPIATDPSLTHTRVPWIFRLPPDDSVQARVLVDGLKARGLHKVGVVSGTDHDSRAASAEMVRAMEMGGLAPVFHLEVDPNVDEPQPVAERVRGFQPDGVVVLFRADGTTRLVSTLHATRPALPVFVPWIPGLDTGGLDDVVSLKPFPAGARSSAFQTEFMARFSRPPSLEAAYTYDATNLVIEAIRRGGLSRQAIQKTLAQMNGYPGVTGVIQWDTGGGNTALPILETAG
jgi:branched-chain amino acid transport system substrate-binding protein